MPAQHHTAAFANGHAGVALCCCHSAANAFWPMLAAQARAAKDARGGGAVAAPPDAGQLTPEMRQLFGEAQRNILELNKSRLSALSELRTARQRIQELGAPPPAPDSARRARHSAAACSPARRWGVGAQAGLCSPKARTLKEWRVLKLVLQVLQACAEACPLLLAAEERIAAAEAEAALAPAQAAEQRVRATTVAALFALQRRRAGASKRRAQRLP